MINNGLRPYETYIDTGTDWLENIPAHWEKMSIRAITELSNKRYGLRDDLELLSVYREFGVVRKNSRDDNHNVESLDLSNYKYVHKGDLVLNKMKMWQGSLGVSKYEGIVSPAYIVCKIKGNINLEYLHLLLRSPKYKTIYNRISYGIRIGQWDMRYDDFKKINLFIPPRSEQDQIVKYLDHKLAKINKFIKAKKKLIAVLKEQKQAIINEAVTKGLDPNVKMKPSGIEWLGDVPEHWEIKRLKNIGNAIIGLTYSPGEICDENGTLVLRSSNIQNGKIYLNDNVYVNKKIPKHLVTKTGDILVCSRNGSRKLVGKCGLIDGNSENLSFGAFTTMFRSEYNNFVYYIFNSALFSYQCGSFFTSTINQLTINDFKAMVVPFPPRKEQDEIVLFTNQKLNFIDKGIVLVEKELDLILEYKNSLISEVVTGKVDVRKIAINESEEEIVEDTELDEDLINEESLKAEDGDE